MNNFYFKHLSILLILGVFIACCFFFVGKFQHYINPKSKEGALRHSSRGYSDGSLRHTIEKKLIILPIKGNELDPKNLRTILHQLMDDHFHARGNNLPINQESIEWMARLPSDHAMSMLQILSHTSPVDWQEQVVSLRNLPKYEQQRALKINRYNSNVYDCSDPTECRG